MMTWQIPRESRIEIAVAALVLEPDLTVARAARRTGLSHTEAQIEPFAALCDEMAATLTERPQLARQVFDHFPAVNERRLWRALYRLVAGGRAQRHGTRCAGSTYTRSSR